MVAPATIQWHWVTQDGARQGGTQAELSEALSSGSLVATTLVWRTGWTEWLPANIVAELAQAIPADQRVPSRAPKRDASVLTPPELPVKAPPPPIRSKKTPPAKPNRTGAASAGSAASSAEKSGLPPLAPNIVARMDPKKEAPSDPAKDTLAPTSFGMIGRPREPQPVTVREPSGPGQLLKGREAMPTLSEEAQQSATATLRSPGAVPPPARGVPAVPALDSVPSYSLEKRSALTTPVPDIEGGSGPEHEIVRPEEISDADPSPSTEPRNVPHVPARSIPAVRGPSRPARAPHAADSALDATLEAAQPIPSAARRTPLPAGARELGPQEDTEPRRTSRSSLTRISRGMDTRTVNMALAAVCVALAVTVVMLSLSHPHAATSAPTPSSSASAALVAVDHTCRVSVPAARLAGSVERNVSPSTVAVEGGVAIGFAASKTRASGLVVDPSTLDASPVFDDDGKDALRGVIPVTQSERVSFVADREDSQRRASRLVDEKPPFSLGLAEGGFSRTRDGSATLLWPLEPDAKLTEPRVASVGPAGYGVTFRRGGQGGKVMLGFVDRQGLKKSELFEINGAPKLLGTPVIAGNDAGVVVAFAARNTADSPWKIYVATAGAGHEPGPGRELVSGSGGGAISPAFTALAGGRWLLQWTEGASGQYQVRVQTFTSDLIAIGNPQLTSPKGANAGQGTLTARDKNVLSLFILTTAGHDELWGANLSCP